MEESRDDRIETLKALVDQYLGDERMKILLREGGLANKGDATMIVTTVSELSKRIGGAQFWLIEDVLADTPEHSSDAVGVGSLRLNSRSTKARAASLGFWCLTHPFTTRQLLNVPNPILTIQQMGKARESLRQVDAVVDISGYAYADTWGPGAAFRTRAYRVAAAHAAKPYVFLPQAWGPFEDPKLQRIFRETCDGADLVVARDEESRRQLTSLAPRPKRPIQCCPDIAFVFKGVPVTEGRQLLTDAGVDLGRKPIIGITPNRRIYDRTLGTGADNQYVIRTSELCRRLNALDYQVVLIAHEIAEVDTGSTDDRLLSSLIAAGAQSSMTHALLGRYSAGQLKAIIGLMDMLVGSRYHSVVAALSQAVPVVTVGWAHKYDELMNDFGLAEFALTHAAAIPDAVVENVQRVLLRHSNIVDRLRSRQQETCRAVGRLFDEVVDVLACR